MTEALLYVPGLEPAAVGGDGLAAPAGGRGVPTPRVAELLGCVPELVDVLASGPDYVVWSVFDCEGAVNIGAMAAVAAVSGVVFDTTTEDEVLRGPVLVVKS